MGRGSLIDSERRRYDEIEDSIRRRVMSDICDSISALDRIGEKNLALNGEEDFILM